MRLIDADAAIDTLKELTANGTNRGMVFGEDAVHRIEILPSAQPEQRWIPVAERLPEEYGEYLVTYKSDGEQIFMDIIEYETSFEYDYEKNRFKGNWLFADDCRSVNPEVLAWMPLPEPYQEGAIE